MAKIVKSVLKYTSGVFGIGGKIFGAVGVALFGMLKPRIPSTNLATGDRLQKTLQVDEFRKIIFGETLLGNDLRYYETFSGNKYGEFYAAATHKVTSFGNLYVDGALVAFTAGVATGTTKYAVDAAGTITTTATSDYNGILKLTTALVGVTATNLAVGAGTLWTAACSMTGCAQFALEWTYSQDKMPGGIPSNIRIVGKGAPVYDPRRDSTNGGSGSHRYNDQTTWAYTTLDGNGIEIGRNNALQAIWYLLGWKIQNPSTSEWTLVAGRGVDPADIDWPSMIVAANAAEAEQYYTDMILSTGDSHTTNEGIISAGGALGEFLDPGGLWLYWVVSDDTASVAVALTTDDVVSGVVWDPAATITSRYNQVGGTYIDKSVSSLYQPQPYPLVSNASYITADQNRKQRLACDFQCVQSAALAQKLARTKLNRSRLTGEFKASFNFKALKARNYNCVTLSFTPLNWTNKLFRVTSQVLNAAGGIDMILREENSSSYAGGSIVAVTAPATGTPYDPATLLAVAGLTATAGSVTGSNGSTFDKMDLSWTTPSNLVGSIEAYYKKHADTNWTPIANISKDVTIIPIQPLQPLTSYDFQVRFISTTGAVGAYSSVTQTSGNNTKFSSPQLAANTLGSNPINLQCDSGGSGGSATDTNVIKFDQITLNDATSHPFTVGAQSLTLSASTSSGNVNALDTGSWSVGTPYAVYIISDGTNVNSLASLNYTAPTVLPYGYTFYAYIGSVITSAGSATTLIKLSQTGNEVSCVDTAGYPKAASGGAGSHSTPTWIYINLTSLVPYRAKTVKFILSGGTGVAMLAADNSKGAFNSTTNPPPLVVNSNQVDNVSLKLTTRQTAYWANAGSANAFVFVTGWFEQF